MFESRPPSPDDSSANKSESSNELSVWDYLIHLPGKYYQKLILRKPVVSMLQDFETTKSQDDFQEKEEKKESNPTTSLAAGELSGSLSTASVAASASPISSSDESSPGFARQPLFSLRLPFGFLINIIREPEQNHAGQKTTVAGSEAVQSSKSPPLIKFSAKRVIKPHVIACSLLLSVTGLWLWFQLTPMYLHWASILLVFNGVLIYLLATRVGAEEEKTLWEYMLGHEAPGSGIAGWQKICLCASLFLAVVAMTSAGDMLYGDDSIYAAFAWGGAVLLALIGGWPLNKKLHKPERVTMILAIGLIIIAFALRGFNVSHNPSLLTGDEASFGLISALFANGEANNIFALGWYSFPSFFNFIQSLFIRVFGQSIEALRLTSVLAGALTVGAVYLFGKKIFNQWVGLFAAVFLAFFHYHNHFSRLGLNNVWDGLWFTAVIGFLWYGWEKGSRISFLFCGLCLGLSQYFYVSSRVLIFLVPVLIFILALLDRNRARQYRIDISLMALICLIVLLPLLYFFLRHPLEYNAPFQRQTIFGDWMTITKRETGQSEFMIILNQIWLSILGLFSQPLRHWYEPTTPLLRPISSFLFFLGLILLLLKWRTSRAYIFIIWLTIIVMAGALSDNTPAAQRYIAIAPVIALIIGFGLAESGAFLVKLRPRYAGWVMGALLTIMIVFGIEELKFYYLDYSPKALLGGENGLVAQRVADALQEKDSTWQVAFFGWPRMGYYSFSTIPYLAPDITGLDFAFPWGSPENPPISGENIIFIFLPEHLDDLNAVRATFPDGRLTEETFNNGTLYWWYEVPAIQ